MGRSTEHTLTDTQLFLCGIKRRRVLPQSVISEHVKKSGLPGIIETQEDELTTLLPQPEVLEDAREPVPQKHPCSFCPV